MSANKKDGGGDGLGVSPSGPARLTPEEFQSIGLFFKQILESSPLKTWIILAGLFAVLSFALDVIRMIWLAIRYFGRF